MNKLNKIKTLSVTAVLSAVAYVLMLLEFSVPFMPTFVKLDFSELPALIAAFALGPVPGVLVCFLKNLLHLTVSGTGGVGELCNFLLGVAFVLPAGWIYRMRHTRKGAFLSCLVGAILMALVSLPLNYFVTYPVYATFLPIDTIIGMYQAIFPGADGLLSCLLIFNLPFTFVKGMLDTLLTFFLYKHISPILHRLTK